MMLKANKQIADVGSRIRSVKREYAGNRSLQKVNDMWKKIENIGDFIDESKCSSVPLVL